MFPALICSAVLATWSHMRVDLARQQIVQSRIHSSIGNGGHRCAVMGPRKEQVAEIGCAASSGIGEIDGLLVGLDIGDELAQILRGDCLSGLAMACGVSVTRPIDSKSLRGS